MLEVKAEVFSDRLTPNILERTEASSREDKPRTQTLGRRRSCCRCCLWPPALLAIARLIHDPQRCAGTVPSLVTGGRSHPTMLTDLLIGQAHDLLANGDPLESEAPFIILGTNRDEVAHLYLLCLNLQRTKLWGKDSTFIFSSVDTRSGVTRWRLP